MVALVDRFYELSPKGSLTIDGYDVRKVTQEFLLPQTNRSSFAKTLTYSSGTVKKI